MNIKNKPEINKATLISIFNRVFKIFQEKPETDLSRFSSSQEKQIYINKMQDILREFAPPQYHNRLLDEIFGLGPLEPLIQDQNISEIIVNGKNHIFYEKKGRLWTFSESFLSHLTFSFLSTNHFRKK